MPTIDYCECYLQENLQPLLRERNYYWNEEQACFQHQRGSFQQSLRFGLRSSTSEEFPAQLYLHLELRAREVEQLVHQFRKFAPSNDSFTAIFTTHKNLSSLQKANLPQLSRQLESNLQHKAIPLLNRFSGVKPLDALFNRNTYQPNKHLGGLLNRCFKGLVLARFSHRRRFTDLYHQYLHRLDRQWAPRNTMDNFTRLYQFLRVYALN